MATSCLSCTSGSRCSGPANADASDKLPPLAIAARETFDAFDDPGTAILNKIQVSATHRGERLGLPGWSIGQIICFDGQSLSKHLGYIQTADNIEAVPVTRLFEAYLARMWGNEKASAAVRIDFIDLDSQFDSIDPASRMLNSSHGIGPDLSRSGRNGPSIYPVTAVGSTIPWVKSQTWTFRFRLFNGVAGVHCTARLFCRTPEAERWAAAYWIDRLAAHQVEQAGGSCLDLCINRAERRPRADNEPVDHDE